MPRIQQFRHQRLHRLGERPVRRAAVDETRWAGRRPADLPGLIPSQCPSEKAKRPATSRGSEELASKLLKRDNWSSYGHADNWVRFQFPFWWTNLVSALDSLSLIGLPPTAESYSRIHKPAATGKSREARLWIALAICRVMKRFCF